MTRRRAAQQPENAAITASCRPVFTIRLVATKPGAIHRLRALLKTLARTHGFRCLSAEEDRERR
jgi:hypothetical protein